MDCDIRQMRAAEYGLLPDFLYLAIFIPEGAAAPPRSVLERPELQVYVRDFGSGPADVCYVAENGGCIVGAAWSRIMDDYGHLADDVPSLAISLYPEFRGQGTGRRLLQALLGELGRRGFDSASLSVQKSNYAVKLYRSLGFRTVAETDEEYLMSIGPAVNKGKGKDDNEQLG